MWLLSFLENDKVVRTRHKILWRMVLLKRSISLVPPVSLPTARCRLAEKISSQWWS